MIEVVIRYDDQKNCYAVYEPSTDSLMVASNLSEALVLLNNFLRDSGLSKVDLLGCDDIFYHIDNKSMKAIIEGNLSLLKRLNNAPSGFMISNQRFGMSPNNNSNVNSNKDGKPDKNYNKRKSFGFAGATGFKNAFKKFGKK